MPVCSRGNRKFRSEEGVFLLQVSGDSIRFDSRGDVWEDGKCETVHDFICPCYTRAMWPLRMWPCTSPRKNGVFLMRLRYNCTLMSCWKTLHLYACWVRPHSLLYPLELGSAFLLFPRDSSVFLTCGPWLPCIWYLFCLSVQKSVVTDMGTTKQMVSYSSHNLFQGSYMYVVSLHTCLQLYFLSFDDYHLMDV